MHKLLPFLSLLTMGACSLPGSFDECTTDSDCPVFEDKMQLCTTDHLCAVGTPAERLCREVYPPKSPANAIVVGALIDSSDINDKLPLEAVKLGIDQVNQRRSGEPPLALHVCDISASVDDAHKSMQVLARRNAVAVIGPPTSSAVFAIKDEVIRSGIPIISYSATAPEISSLGTSSGAVDGLFYRVVPSDSLQGPVLARQLPSPLTGTYALLFVDDPYGRGLRDSFLETVSKAPDLEVSYLEPAGDNDLAGMKRMKQAVASIVHPSSSLDYVVAITNHYSNIIVGDLREFPRPTSATYNIFMTDGAHYDDVLALTASPTNQQLSHISGTTPTADIDNVGGTRAYLKYDSDFKPRSADADLTSNPYAAYAYDAFYAAAIAIGAAGPEVTPGKVSQLLGRINKSDPVKHECIRDQNRTNQIEVGMIGYTAAKDKLSAASGLVLVGASGPICFTPHGDRASGLYATWHIDVGARKFINVPIQ